MEKKRKKRKRVERDEEKGEERRREGEKSKREQWGREVDETGFLSKRLRKERKKKVETKKRSHDTLQRGESWMIIIHNDGG